MTAAQTAPQAPSEPAHAAPSAVEPESRILLSGIEWETYERLCDDLDRSGCHRKLTYDGGTLEIEMPLKVHEIIKMFLTGFMDHYLAKVNPDALPVGQTTYKDEVLAKGLEPDSAYYITNHHEVDHGPGDRTEPPPPPDLSIEVEITRPLLNKLGVYAALEVHEIWHVARDGSARILRLDGDQYVEIPASRELPQITADLLTYWVQRRLEQKHYPTIQAFLQSLAEND